MEWSESSGFLRLDVLGLTIEVPAELMADFEGLPRSTARADVRLYRDDSMPPLAALTAQALQHSPLLCIHAGVVSGLAGVIAFPGASGLGKTTLTAALVQAGYRYLSDEALALDRESGLALPFARPLALNADVWPLFGPAIGPAPPLGSEGLVPASRLGAVDEQGGRVAHILLATREPGRVQVRPAARGDAVQALLSKAFNHFRAPESSFRAVVEMVRQARVWRVSYNEAPELAAALADTLG